MRINTQRFLPSSNRSENTNFVVPLERVVSRNTTRTNVRSNDNNDQLNEIKDKLIDIDKLLQSIFSSRQRNVERTRRSRERTEFVQREESLETKKPKGINLPEAPKDKTGIFGGLIERFKKFIFFTVLGWIVPKLVEFLPTLIKIFKILGSVYKFFEDVVGKLFDAFTGFLEFGFGIQEKLREGIKAIGGEGAAKVFDQFNGALSTLVNTLLITGMLFSGGISGILQDIGDNSGCCCGNNLLDLPNDLLDERERIRTENQRTRTPGEGPRITGDVEDGPFSRLRRFVDEKNPFRRRPGVTGDRGPFSGLRRAIEERNPFRRRPTITTSGGEALKTPSVLERIQKFIGGVGTQIGEFGKKIYKNISPKASELYKTTLATFSEQLGGLKKKGSEAALELLAKGKGVLGEVGKELPHLLKKLKTLKNIIPYVGDIAGFFIDVLIDGIDWRRALIRSVTGAAIDAGFDALVGALALASPFSMGTTAALAVAIYAAYMATDALSGGFGVILGDKIADFFKLPYKAGDKGGDAPSPGSVGSNADIEKLKNELEKKRKEDPKFDAKISATENSKNQPPNPPNSTQQTPENKTQKTETGGLILPQKEERKTLTSNIITRGGKQVEGNLTRGGKQVGGDIERTLTISRKRLEVPRIEKLRETIVGKDVSGGEESIIKLYGGTKNEDNKKNGYLTLLNSGKSLKEIPFGIGSIMGSLVDALLGQEPVGDVTRGLSQGISYLINDMRIGSSIEESLNKFFTFSNGGEVPSPLSLDYSQDQITPDVIGKIIEPPVREKMNTIFKLVNEQSLKQDRSNSAASSSSTSPTDASSGADSPNDKPQPIATGSGSGGVVQWLHGNPNRPGYDREGHGLESNAHDHFGFSSREFAVKGFNALKSAGYSPYEFEGFTSVGRHSATGGHYGPVGANPTHGNKDDGSAFDVPWSTPPYAGGGRIGPKDYQASDNAARIVGALNGGTATTGESSGSGNSKMGSPGKFHGGFVNKGGLVKVHDKEYWIDADSVKLFGKDFFDTINQIENRSQIPLKIPSLIATLKSTLKDYNKESLTTSRDQKPLKLSSTNTEQKPKIYTDKNTVEKQLNNESGLIQSNISDISNDLIIWAKANKSMIEKFGTRSQKDILAKVEKREVPSNDVTKMISGGQISDKKYTLPSINRFTLDNDPYSNSQVIYIQPYIVEKPVSSVSKTMGYSYVGNSSGGSINERIMSLLRN